MDLLIDKDEFVAMEPLERIRAIDRAYGDKALQLASMQKTACTIMHMIHRLRAKTVILFVDTQFHFQQTLDLRDEYARKYGLEIITVTPELTPDQQERHFGRQLYNYVDGQPMCCEMRKEKPFLKAAREMGIKATIAGLLRDEGGSRGKIEPIGRDPRLDCATFHPLFDWTHEQVDAYAEEHGLPVHPLYAENYLSIGCAPCTTPVRPGEDRRAGRWRHLRGEDGKKPEYCNINFSDLGGGI
jgi:phosphoadenosine phosphosulfate reductase